MENYRSRRVSFGAESDRVGRTFMEIPEHLRQPRMPLGAIHGGDIDSADVSFDGLSCPGGVPYFQRQQTEGNSPSRRSSDGAASRLSRPVTLASISSKGWGRRMIPPITVLVASRRHFTHVDLGDLSDQPESHCRRLGIPWLGGFEPPLPPVCGFLPSM